MGAASVKHTRLKAIKQCSKIRFSRSHFTIGPHLKCDVLCLWIEKSCNTYSSNICPGDHGEQPHPVSLLCSHFPSVSIAVCDCNQLTRMIALCSKSRYHHGYANMVVSLSLWQDTKLLYARRCCVCRLAIAAHMVALKAAMHSVPTMSLALPGGPSKSPLGRTIV